MVSVPAFGQFDKPGLNSRFNVEAGGQEFEILTTANFDVSDAKFDLSEKTLILSITSGLENNLGETTIPKSLLGGELEITLDDQAFEPNVRSNDKIWFITAEFQGKGMHTMKITGTESVKDAETVREDIPETNPDDNGCLIATAAYGSEMGPQVQLLREVRDNTVLATQSGSAFMAGFNQFYYSFSPAVADWERQNPVFKEAVRAAITPLLSTLSVLNHAEIDSEPEMLGYGLGIIAMNVGIYFGPAAGLVLVRRLVLDQ